MVIRRASLEYPTFAAPPAERVHVALALQHALPLRLPADPQPTLTAGRGWTILAAVVNHGRWVVACPSCSSAQLADPDDPRFFCDRCANADHGGGWARVQFPKPAELAAIEAVLAARPSDEYRNWSPPETVADLVVENEAHGVPVPLLVGVG